MAFLRIKRIKKQSYLYLVKNTWDKKKQQARQKVIKYYGKIENGHIDDKIIYERDNYQCQRCNSKSNLSIDHKIPTSRGGKDKYDNVWILCEQCNRIKRTLDECGNKIEKKFHLLTKLKFWIQAFENDYKKKQKEKRKKLNKKLMKKSITQRKEIKKIMDEIRELGIDKELKYEGYI